MITVSIRPEIPADVARIREVTEMAFRGAEHTCGREHLLVDALRNAGELTLSLVAVSESGIVGHVAVSPVKVTKAAGEWFGLGPISVLPEFQRQGIGKRLMEVALAQLRARGARGCALVGDPGFYGRFGFKSDPALVVPGVPPEVSLSLRFVPGEDRGEIEFHAAFAEAAGAPADAGDEIIALEREALRRWCNADPSGFLEISAPDVVYFDPMLGRRLDGLEALTRYYEPLRGQIRAERFELLNPLVQRVGDAAVLTFNFVSHSGDRGEMRWNCTEVYRRAAGRWKIIQTHWSFTQPKLT